MHARQSNRFVSFFFVAAKVVGETDSPGSLARGDFAEMVRDFEGNPGKTAFGMSLVHIEPSCPHSTILDFRESSSAHELEGWMKTIEITSSQKGQVIH